MPMVRRRYFIDNHLGRFRKALNHLYELKAFDEVKTFVVKHGLYAEALDLYRYQNENLSDIMNLYAEHLHQTSRFKEAGIGKFRFADLSLTIC